MLWPSVGQGRFFLCPWPWGGVFFGYRRAGPDSGHKPCPPPESVRAHAVAQRFRNAAQRRG
eukprot:4178042-Lingulodinium_polyedra.AAC.1